MWSTELEAGVQTLVVYYTLMCRLSTHFGCHGFWSDKRNGGLARHHILHVIKMVPTENVKIAKQPDYC